ncbi:terminase small subunit [Mixta intestinalis]|uniref:Terminase small subunit n=1 Tax=Mixta intestinalis TaxID=1615494 RepID=A0A6P1PXJ8_9GAMM|nr:terminase small subunit [Mixta intestinalis]QHM71290.1 hypothetical protein C7M51_01576 [Mixta intestinalis]
MAKPDWGELQKRFLSDHAETGISPKAWCEQQGLNYTSARRYIKKPAAQQNAQTEMRSSAQKQSKTEIAQESITQNAQKDAQESDGVLKAQHEMFAQNVAQGMGQKEAAICAGYSPTRAESQASILMKRPDVRARVRELRQEAALLVSFNAKDLADLSYNAAKAALNDKKFGQVAPNIKNAAQLTGIEMSNNKTEVNVDLAGLSYGKVCVVTPATCPPEVWAAHMEKLREGKTTAQQ